MSAGPSRVRGRPLAVRTPPRAPVDMHSYAAAGSDDSEADNLVETLQDALKQEVDDDGEYHAQYVEVTVEGAEYRPEEGAEDEGEEEDELEGDGESVETYYYTEDGDIVTDTGEIAGYIESEALSHVQVHEGEMDEEQGEDGEMMEVAYKCSVCSDSFFSYDDLRVHSEEQHAASMFRCAKCDKMFRGHGNWWRHMKQHTDDPRYRFPCQVCHKVFTQKANMMKHMNIHLGVKNFGCTVCGKAFGQKANLNKHMLVHSGALLHECEVCGKRFSQKANLKKHNQIHTGEYSFECDICHKKFIQKINCQKHMRTHRDLVVRADCKMVGPDDESAL